MTTHVAATVPYPWPYDGCLDGADLALVVCGAQRGLAAQSSAVGDVLDALGSTADVVRGGRGRVVWVRHGRRLGAGADRGALPTRESSEWQLVVTPHADDLVVDAAGWDGCYASDLDHALRSHGVRHVVLGGLASELTVDSTVRTLNDRGHECLVLTDGCAPVDPALGARAHHSLTMSGGIFGALGTVAELTAALDALAPLDTRSSR
jgi:biuret amidohydrolase